MTLVLELKKALLHSMKEKNEIKKDILRVVLGEISTVESRGGKSLSDDEAGRVIRKVMQSNDETMKYLKKDSKQYRRLTAENIIMNSFLPRELNKEEIVDALSAVVEKIKDAKSDGQATGIAMKHLVGMSVSGELVKNIVQEIRA